MNKVIIIAEAGPNHNGKIKNAFKLIDIAKRCGADFIKFQTSKPENHISKFAKKANYQFKNTSKKNSSQLQMSKKMTLSYKDFDQVYKYCKKKKINFLSTAFDLESIDFLRRFKMKYIKIPSGEITNLPYLIKVAKLKKKILLSTGMSNSREISKAIQILIKNGSSKNKITVLQCNTEYPTPLSDVNLKAMKFMSKKFKTNVGYSDHTLGIEASLAAVAMGAKVIEKHFTISKKLKGPDHKASLEENELKQLIQGIRNVEVVIGKEEKKLTKSEKKNINIARNSIVAASKIKRDEKFTKLNITIKRPGNGISPMKYFEVLGKKAKKNFIKDELIKI